ncbi:MAG: RNA polymerase sigma factor [Desulfobulbus sp.]|nr:RNA polymerase sigma factor [Desulfobulbus sp.]
METFHQFYTANKEKLFGYLVRKSGNGALACDLVQESFTRYMEQYRHREKSLALLFTIGRNLLNDHMRQNRRNVEISESTIAGSGDEEQKYIQREESQLVLSGLQQLDEDDRDILALVVSSGMTYREIAETRGLSESAVKVKVHRARQKLRQLLARG